MRLHGGIAVVLLSALGGCGSTESPATPTGCEAKKNDCLADQKACAMDSSGQATCVECPAGQYAALSGQCAPLSGTPIQHDFADFTTDAGEEIADLCQSWTLNNAEEIWVSAVELTQDAASHHSNWTFVPNTDYDGPDGVWPCRQRNYNQVAGALSGGVLYAQSTQAAHEVQHFPAGAAVRIPPWSRIIGDVHLLNASTKSITGHVRLALYGIARNDVKVKLTPLHMTWDQLAIPPHARSRFTGECYPGDNFDTAQSHPWDLQIYYILPHFHSLGRRFFVSQLGGSADGRMLFDESFSAGEAHGRAFDPPLDLSGASGMRFGCEFDNPRDDEVNWGIGDQEMCEFLGFGASAMGFESTVIHVTPDGADGTTQKFGGSCSTLIFPWNFDSPGGEPRP